MRKFISLLLILSLALVMGALTFASDDYKDEGNFADFDFDVPARLQQVEFDPNLVSARGLTEEDLTNIWASFRYNEALPEDVRNSILLARYDLVFQETWSGDKGCETVVVYPDGTRRYVPYWDTVFPYWDMKQILALEPVPIIPFNPVFWGQVRIPFANNPIDGQLLGSINTRLTYSSFVFMNTVLNNATTFHLRIWGPDIIGRNVMNIPEGGGVDSTAPRNVLIFFTVSQNSTNLTASGNFNVRMW